MAGTTSIDLNCDMGESYGRWTLGADEEIMPYITSANVACGYHGGDPHVMRKTVALALQHGVAIGSHPGLPDLMGFGRRVMDVTAQEVKDYLCYQTGALREFVRAAGGDLQHMKPHGILYNMMERDEALAAAAGRPPSNRAARTDPHGHGHGVYDRTCRKMGVRVSPRASPTAPTTWSAVSSRARSRDHSSRTPRKRRSRPCAWPWSARCGRSTASTSTSPCSRSAAMATRRGPRRSCGPCGRRSRRPAVN